MKKARPTNFVNLTCSKCGAKAHAAPGSKHRRCGGSEGANIKDKRNERLPMVSRGTWS